MRNARTLGRLALVAGGTMALIFYESLANSWILGSLKDRPPPPTTSSRSSSGDDPAAVVERLARSRERCHPDGNAPAETTAAAKDAASKSAAAVRRLLHDPTLDVSPCVDRPWVDGVVDGPPSGLSGAGVAAMAMARRRRPQQRRGVGAWWWPSPPPRPRAPPPYKVLLTNFGWNHPDQRGVGLNVTRSIRSREFVTGIVNHPYFDPTDWDDVQQQVVSGSSRDDTRYYVFVDVETCFESNYPVYGGGFGNNSDGVGGRSVDEDRVRLQFDCYAAPNCPAVHRVLESPLFRLRPNHTTLLYLDCWGDFMPWDQRRGLITKQFAVAVYSARVDQIDPRGDQGLAPPAVTRVALTAQQARDISTCAAEARRPYLFTFVGSVRNEARAQLVRLHDPAHGVVSIDLYDAVDGAAAPVNFTDLLLGSAFAGAPLGDNLFSYRFAEVLAAGAIPVVHSDGWVLPFRPELVDWSGCLLHLPESSIPDTVDILRNVTAERRCRMRNRCMEIYHRYMADGEGTIRGLLDGLELVKAAEAKAVA